MESYIFQFKASDFRKIEARSLGFLLSSGHCSNELSALMPYIAFEHTLEGTNDVEAALIISRRYTIDRIVVSKVVEYNKLCADFVKSIPQGDTSFASILKADVEAVRSKIKPPKWALIMRNKASFHYDQSFATSSMHGLDDEHPLRLIAGKIKGITLFEFSEEILSHSIFKEAGQGDIGIGLSAVRNFLLMAISVITTFQATSMIAAFKHFELSSSRDRVDLREEYCGDPSALKIPLSLSEEGIRNFNSANTK